MAKDDTATFERPAPPAPRLAPMVKGDSAVEFAEWRDGALVCWHVQEMDARNVPGARGASCLVFFCDTLMRRVWGYPADWRSLDGDGLALLSWGR